MSRWQALAGNRLPRGNPRCSECDGASMSIASISSTSFWANQISALSAQRALQPNAVTAAGGTSPGSSSAAVSSRGQIAQDLQSFTQSLLQALVSNQPASNASGISNSVAGTGSTDTTGSAPASVLPHGHGHHHGGARSKLESLIDTLNGGVNSSVPTGSSGSTSSSVANVNASFNKLMTDLGASAGTGAASGVAAAGSAAGVTSSQQSTPPLQERLLQGMLQHLQQQGARAASLGQGLHVVA